MPPEIKSKSVSAMYKSFFAKISLLEWSQNRNVLPGMSITIVHLLSH